MTRLAFIWRPDKVSATANPLNLWAAAIQMLPLSVIHFPVFIGSYFQSEHWRWFPLVFPHSCTLPAPQLYCYVNYNRCKLQTPSPKHRTHRLYQHLLGRFAVGVVASSKKWDLAKSFIYDQKSRNQIILPLLSPVLFEKENVTYISRRWDALDPEIF